MSWAPAFEAMTGLRPFMISPGVLSPEFPCSYKINSAHSTRSQSVVKAYNRLRPPVLAEIGEHRSRKEGREDGNTAGFTQKNKLHSIYFRENPSQN